MSKSANKGRQSRRGLQEALQLAGGDGTAQTDVDNAEGKTHKSTGAQVAGKVSAAAFSVANKQTGESDAAQNSEPQDRNKLRWVTAATAALQDASSGGAAPVGGGRNDFLLLSQANSSADDSGREGDDDDAGSGVSTDDEPVLRDSLPSGGMALLPPLRLCLCLPRAQNRRS